MDPLWTWGGTFFGYRVNGSLYSHHGREVGRFKGDQIYDGDGRYIGEVKQGKLITGISSKGKTGGQRFTPSTRVGWVAYVSNVGTVMYAGYEDFPSPDEFK